MMFDYTSFPLLVPFLFLSGSRVLDVATAHQAATSGVHGWNGRSLQAAVGQVDQLILYDASTDQPLLTLTDGMVVNTNTRNGSCFNVIATTISGAVGSVKFGYNGKSNVRTEKMAPYALCGNVGSSYNVCSFLTVGPPHNLTVTSYSGSKANGTIGSVRTLSFRIVNDPIIPVPPPLTNVPSKVPVSITPSTHVPASKLPTNVPSKTPVSAVPTTHVPVPVSCPIPKVKIHTPIDV